MRLYHLTADPDFAIDETATVIGWGVKNEAPCEMMTGVLYVAADITRWTQTTGFGGWDRRKYVAEIEIADHAVEGVDFHTLSETETLITNLTVATVTAVNRREQA
jgi:hypothetical protein